MGVLLIAFTLAAPPMVNPYREEGRSVLERHCGQCHRADLPTAVPKALAVFTLNDIDWSRKMTIEQLKDAQTRVRETGSIDRAEVALFDKFIEAELQRRARAQAPAQTR